MSEDPGATPPVRRIGRRRVVSGEPPAGREVDPTRDDRADPADRIRREREDATRDEWLRRQRPPHWG